MYNEPCGFSTARNAKIRTNRSTEQMSVNRLAVLESQLHRFEERLQQLELGYGSAWSTVDLSTIPIPSFNLDAPPLQSDGAMFGMQKEPPPQLDRTPTSNVTAQSPATIIVDQPPTGDLYRETPMSLSSVAGDGLPPLEETLPLVQEFFQRVNAAYPLFHESQFMRIVRCLYTQPPSQHDPLHRASLQVVLSHAHRIRAMHFALQDQDYRVALEDSKASELLRASQSVLSDLTTAAPSLLSVQVLLNMTMIYKGTFNQQPALVLLAIAIRLAHRIRLHARVERDPHGNPLDPELIEQRRKVFWIAYVLDKDLSLHHGQPSLIDDDDTDLELPPLNPEDGSGDIYTLDGRVKFNLFRSRVDLACIESRIYKDLFSLRARGQSDIERESLVKSIETALEDWKNSLPPEFRVENIASKVSSTSLIHISIVHFVHFHSLARIYRVYSRDAGWIRNIGQCPCNNIDFEQSLKDLSHQLPLVWPKMVTSARSCLSLKRHTPQGDSACSCLALDDFQIIADSYAASRFVMCAAITALLILLANTIHNPTHPLAKNDLSVVDAALYDARQLSEKSGDDMLARMCMFCSELVQRARIAVENLAVQGLQSDNTNTAATKRRRIVSESLQQQREAKL
ncbi:hypothetical protein NA57DRAFT_57956 [Rhizodiscina lignyota]|uniref:Xylanolytic transcriptional activator regulatory domain-containing protein n=1 Tax=Rhizodiscina lignyota TaxID=1504668 RepID=A0A9P4IDP5_9PEZI|nr:hypothetical protein NA57DRAFT_57956 [Rhizodiscina lignyota]